MQEEYTEIKVLGMLTPSRINGIVETLKHNREQAQMRNDRFERGNC